MGGDFFRLVHKGGQRVTKPLDELLGAFGDEVAKEVGFEAQPEPLNAITIGTVAR